MFSYQKDRETKPGNLPKSGAGLDLEKHWIEEYFCLVLVELMLFESDL